MYEYGANDNQLSRNIGEAGEALKSYDHSRPGPVDCWWTSQLSWEVRDILFERCVPFSVKSDTRVSFELSLYLHVQAIRR